MGNTIEKRKDDTLKQAMSFLLSICMIVNMAIPSMAQTLLPGEVNNHTEEIEIQEDEPPIVIGESEDNSGNEELPQPDDNTDEKPDSNTTGDFTGGGADYFTEIQLTVKDTNGDPVPEVKYGLYLLEDESIYCTMDSDENGIATSGEIPINTDYYLEEIDVPENYIKNKGRFEIILKNQCPPSRISLGIAYTAIYGQIKVIKTDEDGKLLTGVVFEVYLENDTKRKNVLDTITTGEDGTAITKVLPYGKYVLYESETLEGFSAGEEYPAAITNPNEIVELEVVNYYTPTKITITKKGDDGKLIEGAIFGLYKSETDELIQELITDSTGKASSREFRAGWYYIKELSVPEPYQIDTKMYIDYFWGLEDNNYTFINEIKGGKGKLKIIKQDQYGDFVEGVRFKLYREWDNEFIGELVTDKNGIAERNNLVVGEYYLKEYSCPSDYEKIEEKIPFVSPSRKNRHRKAAKS